MSLLFFGFIFCTILALLYLVRNPLRVKKALWIDPHPMPITDPPALEDWPEVAQFLENGDQFESLGYQKEGLIVISEMTPNALVFYQPFRSFEDVSSGSLTVTLSKANNAWRVVDKRIGFQTHFSDESSITSGFASTLEILGPPEGHEKFLITWTENIAELFSIHQRLTGHLAGDQIKIDLVAEKFGGDMSMAIMSRAWADWKRACETKYFYLEQGRKNPASESAQTPINPYAAPNVSPQRLQEDRVFLTYRGAYRLTWGLLFPVKQIRRWISGRKTKRVLRRC